MKHSYCVCVIHYETGNRQHMAIHDFCHFPNPEKKPEAIAQCLERAELLPKIIRESAEIRRMLNLPDALPYLRVEAIHYREL